MARIAVRAAAHPGSRARGREGPGALRGRVNLPVLGAVLVVLGFWIGGKFHPLGFILAAIPIGIWAWLSFAHWRRERRADREPRA